MTETMTTSATGGMKAQKPAQLSQIDPLALWELSEVAAMGADKYDRGNYLKGYDWSLCMDAANRHFMLWQMGESVDPESGHNHLAHAAWHMLALISFEQRQIGTDDRLPTVPRDLPGTPVFVPPTPEPERDPFDPLNEDNHDDRIVTDPDNPTRSYRLVREEEEAWYTPCGGASYLRRPLLWWAGVPGWEVTFPAPDGEREEGVSVVAVFHDRDGDIWTRNQDGDYKADPPQYGSYWAMSHERLAAMYGPLTPVTGGGE